MKHLKTILLSLIGASVVITGIYFVMTQGNSKPVKVFETSMFSMTEDWAQQTSYSGSVITDKLQPVYVSSTQTITEILVEEGQEVKKGDILLTYDSTLSELSLVRKQLQIQKTQLEIDRASKELEVINTYRPGVPVVIASEQTGVKYLMNVPTQPPVIETREFKLIYEGVNTEGLPEPNVALYRIVVNSEDEPIKVEVEITPIPIENGYKYVFENLTIQEAGVQYEYTLYQLDENGQRIELDGIYTSANGEQVQVKYNHEPEHTIINQLYVPTEPPKYPNLLSGEGSNNDPYIFLYSKDLSINNDFMEALLENLEPGSQVYAIFKVFEGDNPEGEVIQSFAMRFDKSVEGSNMFTFLSIDLVGEGPIIDIPDDPGEFPGDFPVDPGPPTISYTAEEIFKMRTEKEAQIRELQLTKKTAEIELKNLETEKNNNFVLAQLDGVVSELIDQETARNENKQLFQVSSSGSFIVETYISELDLEEVKVGDMMHVMAYETGTAAEGEVISISSYPTSSPMYYGPGSSTQSYYPIRLKVDKSANLRNGMWVEVTRVHSEQPGEQFFALMKAFIRTDDGEPYVWVAENNRLTKRFVKIGRVIHNQYIVILDNAVTIEDRVAFPYGKSLREGVEVEEGTFEDLYNPLGG